MAYVNRTDDDVANEKCIADVPRKPRAHTDNSCVDPASTGLANRLNIGQDSDL
jgi:hypothetical protein